MPENKDMEIMTKNEQAENKSADEVMPDRDEALFAKLSADKKRKKKKMIIIIISVAAAVLVAGIWAVSFLRSKVGSFQNGKVTVTSAKVTRGSISTTVSGSGSLQADDTQVLSIPDTVEINEIVCKANDSVSEGDLIATVNMTSVVNSMSSVQSQLASYDKKLAAAENDKASTTVKAGVSGRVKRIYTKAGENVIDRMASSGALIELSTDGYMAVDIDTKELKEKASVVVKLSNGKKITGKVSSSVNGKATVLVTDNGTKYGDAVTVLSKDGKEIGGGKLYIHSPIKITGFAGTVSKVCVSLNSKVKASTVVLKLKNTSYSANYDSILRQRNEKEEELMTLLKIYKDGAILAPVSGSVMSVYDEDAQTEDAAPTNGTSIDVVTLSPDKTMSVDISVDEAKILSVKEGQRVDVTVSSIGDEVYEGEVTQIGAEAESSSGVTKYTVTVTLKKEKNMLVGMTAKAVIRIQGVDDALMIPIEALHKTSTKAYVYTAYDEEAKSFSGQKEVTFGISNDDNVEITSGLSEGDTVYYEQVGNQFGFGNMGGPMGGMGNFPMGGSGSTSGQRPDFGGQRPDGTRKTRPSGSSNGKQG